MPAGLPVAGEAGSPSPRPGLSSTIDPGKAALKDPGLQPSDIALRPIELPIYCSSALECCAEPFSDPAYTAFDGSFRAKEVARNSRAES